MLLGLIIAVGAGWLSRSHGGAIVDALSSVLPRAVLDDPAAVRVMGFGVALFGAAVVLTLLHAGASPALMVLGALVGHFHPELRVLVNNRRG